MKKEIFIKLLFGAVIAYLVSLLLFVTCKHVFSLDANYLSALGSILSAGATFFAAFTAWLLFTDWRGGEHFGNKLKLLQESINACGDLCDELRLIAHPIAKLKANVKSLNSELKEALLTIDEMDALCFEIVEQKVSQNRGFRKLQVLLNRCFKYFEDEEFNSLKKSVSGNFENYFNLKISDTRDLIQLEKECEELLKFISKFTKELEDDFIIQLDEKSSPYYSKV